MHRVSIRHTLGLAALFSLAAILTSPVAFAADVLVGTGRAAQTHFDVGRAICRQVEKASDGLTCEALGIEGGDAAEPIAVLSEVRNGAIEIGLVPSDWQYHAVQGSGPVAFMDVKFDNLRSLFSLHGELFTLVARRDSGINSLDDLAGRRVNIGNPGSNQRAVMDAVMAAKGWSRDSFQLTEELAETEQSLALCHNRVQAMVLTVAHPYASLAKTMELCDANLVEVSGAAIDKLLADNGYLTVMEVPGGSYEGADKPVKTFGVTVTVISSSDMDEELIYDVTRSLFDNLDDFKRLHPALGDLTPERMMTDGLSAPVHPGAVRYYRERGMM